MNTLNVSDQVIKAGYRLTVTTWEDGGDNYRTEILDGLSKEQCAFYVDICKAFARNRDSPRDQRICNIYDPGEREIVRIAEAIRAIVNNHPGALFAFATQERMNEMDKDDLVETLFEPLHNLAISGVSEFLTRVVYKWEVHYVPNDVVFTDVRREFK